MNWNRYPYQMKREQLQAMLLSQQTNSQAKKLMCLPTNWLTTANKWA